MTRTRLMIWGLNDTGRAVAQAAIKQKTIDIVGVWSDLPAQHGRDLGTLLGINPLGVMPVSDTATLLAIPADYVVIANTEHMTPEQLDNLLNTLLSSGRNVIAAIPDSRIAVNPATILAACQRGNSTFHTTGVLPHLMLERFATTLAKALQRVEHIHMVQSIDCSKASPDMWGSLSRIGLGHRQEGWQPFPPQHGILQAVANNVARQVYGQQDAGVQLVSSMERLPAGKRFKALGRFFEKDDIAALHITHRAFLHDHCFLTAEEIWYLDAENAPTDRVAPYGYFQTPYRFSFEVTGVPSTLNGQLEFEPCHDNINPLVNVMAQGVMSALPAVCAAEPGILLHESAPRYQLDSRMPASNASAISKSASINTAATVPSHRQKRKYRVVIWGPGEIGGAVTRAALQRDDIEIVGAKVFSPGKDGKDLGELVGIAPIGINATRSKEAIKALKPDCVIVTPQPRAIVEGLDNDVMELLEAGINIITSAAYHNVTMPNWLVSSQTPYDLLKEVANTTAMAKNRREAIALSLNRKLIGASQSGLLKKLLPPMLDTLLKPAIEKAMPFRATPEKIQAACRKGNSTLHGTGVHPTFMAERVGLQMAGWLDHVQHMRFIECADFSYMPDGMWGGLETLGFGKPVATLDENYLIAKAGDFYYGDVTGNVAHLLFGRPGSQVRIKRRFRALPARNDFRVGSRLIRKGCSAALHMVHEGYIGQHHFFTNEECWYLGPECEFRGDNLPFGNYRTPLSYTLDITGKPSSLRFQLSMDGTGRAAELLSAGTASANQRCALGQQMRQEGVTNPITNATAMAILDAVGPVCDMPAGVAIDDIRPGFHHLAVK